MKLVLGTFVFFLALGLSFQTLANNNPEVCSAEKTDNCVTNGNPAPHTQGEANSHKSKLGEEMNSLFPEKQKNPEKVARPTAVKLVSPKFRDVISATTAKLEWAAAEGANSYHVQVATDPNFKWLVVNEHLIQGTNYEVKDLQPGTTYFWRIASTKSDNDSMYTKSLFESSLFSTPAK
jgi:hypothetical protein